MANHKSALKRISQSERRRKRNQHIRSKMRTVVKRYREALESGNASQAGEAFKVVEREIRRAASRGVIPKRRADRSVGRLAKRLNAVSQ
ncbi:MAG: 30S ribosomal protein S20 [Myxococcota bacterium]